MLLILYDIVNKVNVVFVKALESFLINNFVQRFLP